MIDRSRRSRPPSANCSSLRTRSKPITLVASLVAVIKTQFQNGGGSHEEYGVAVRAAIVHGWLTMHPSGADLSFTQAEAELFA